jgi:siroheme decarboxylase
MSSPQLDQIDKRILLALQGDLSDCLEPFTEISRSVHVSESEIIDRIRSMIDSGVIRRLGAMLRHIEAGIGFNGMVVWKVDSDKTEKVGEILADFPEVSHCYERIPFGAKGGTLFTMVHSSTKEECMTIVEKMAGASGIYEYEILFSERELKKVSMTYFDETD